MLKYIYLAWLLGRYSVAWLFALCVGALACVLYLLCGAQRMWLWLARPWAVGTLWILGVQLRVEGVKHLRGPAIFISNHQSLIDVVFMPAILPRRVRFVAKRELRHIPLWGWALTAVAVMIDRQRPRQALRTLYQGLDRLPPGWSLVMFPEGTRPSDGVMHRFKKGAFHMAAYTHLPVVPLGMAGAHAIVPPHAWLIRPGVVQIVVGPALNSTTWRLETVAAHTRTAEAAVAACVAQAQARLQEPQGPLSLHTDLG